MFAPLVAETQAKESASSSNKQTQKRPTQEFAGSTVEQILFLQRTIGNQATGRLLSQRAARARAIPAQAKSPLTLSPLPGVLQAKLEVGALNDPLEREADRVAEHVMRMPDPGTHSGPAVSAGAPGVQRKCSCGGSCDKCKAEQPDEEQSKVQRKPAAPQISAAGLSPASSGMTAPPIVHEVLRSPGQPLNAATRAFFEPRFGRDFSRVRVHTDAKAEESARAVDALAYTVGDHIVFGLDHKRNLNGEGSALVAHELVHVAQQKGGLVWCQRAPAPPAATPRGAESCMQTYGLPMTVDYDPIELGRDKLTLEGVATVNIDSWTPYLMRASDDLVKEVFASRKEFAFWSSLIRKTAFESLEEFPVLKQVLGAVNEVLEHYQEKEFDRQKDELTEKLIKKVTRNQDTARKEAKAFIEHALNVSRGDPSTPCGKRLEATKDEINTKYPHMDDTKYKKVKEKIEEMHEAIKRKMEYEKRFPECLADAEALTAGAGPGSRAPLGEGERVTQETKESWRKSCYDLPDPDPERKKLTKRRY